MAMRADKEITMIWQALVITALYGLAILVFSTLCSVIIYLCIHRVDLPLLWGFLGAAGLAVITLALSRKYFASRSIFRPTKQNYSHQPQP
jgi:uncharacterized integral membrane protein